MELCIDVGLVFYRPVVDGACVGTEVDAGHHDFAASVLAGVVALYCFKAYFLKQ